MAKIDTYAMYRKHYLYQKYILSRKSWKHERAEITTYAGSQWDKKGQESLHKCPIIFNVEYPDGVIKGNGIEIGEEKSTVGGSQVYVDDYF